MTQVLLITGGLQRIKVKTTTTFWHTDLRVFSVYNSCLANTIILSFQFDNFIFKRWQLCAPAEARLLVGSRQASAPTGTGPGTRGGGKRPRGGRARGHRCRAKGRPRRGGGAPVSSPGSYRRGNAQNTAGDAGPTRLPATLPVTAGSIACPDASAVSRRHLPSAGRLGPPLPAGGVTPRPPCLLRERPQTRQAPASRHLR